MTVAARIQPTAAAGWTPCAARIEALDVSWHSVTHDLVSLVVSRAHRCAAGVRPRLPRRRVVAGPPCLLHYPGVVGLVLLVLLFSGVAESWTGVVQRVLVTVLLPWIAILIQLSRVRPAEHAI